MSMALPNLGASRGRCGSFRWSQARSATGAAKARTSANCGLPANETETSMIQLKDVSYVRLGSPDLESAENFATSCLGLEVAERGRQARYLRSDERAHTLCYSERDPRDQSVGFEVEDE